MTTLYSKLPSTLTGTFHVIEVRPATRTIDQDGIRNTVFVDKATVAPSGRETPTENSKTQTENNPAGKEETNERDHKTEEENVAKAPLEYTIAHLVRQVGKVESVKYVVHWCGYTTADDTVETPAHIPDHFITRFGAEREGGTKGNKNREKEIWDEKESTPRTVQGSMLMKMYRRIVSRYPKYMEKLSMILQRGE